MFLKGKAEEAVTRLSRVGYDNTLGYLEGGIEAWSNSGRDTDTLESISAEVFADRVKNDSIHILDVRKDGEFNSMHLENAQHFALDYINEQMNEIDRDKTYYIHCAGRLSFRNSSFYLKSAWI